MEAVDDWSAQIVNLATRPFREVSKGYTSFAENDVLLAKITPCMENGKCAIARGLRDRVGFGSTEFHVLRASKYVLPEWLFYFWRLPETRRNAERSMTGTAGQKRVPSNHLERIKIPLPDLSEQKRIAELLEQTDRLRRTRRYALELCDTFLSEAFTDLFGEPLQNTKGWPLRSLGELALRPPNNGIFRRNEDYGEGARVIWVEDLFRGNALDTEGCRRLTPTEEERRKYSLNYGDILFCRSSLKLEGLGYNNVFLGTDGEALFECHIIRISPNLTMVEPRFLNHALRMPGQRARLFRFAKTVTMSTIDQDGLLEIALPVPPISLQTKFAGLAENYERVRVSQREALRQADHLFQSLLHRTFS